MDDHKCRVERERNHDESNIEWGNPPRVSMKKQETRVSIHQPSQLISISNIAPFAKALVAEGLANSPKMKPPRFTNVIHQH